VSDKRSEATHLIIEQVAEAGIKLVASLLDDWIADVIRASTVTRDSHMFRSTAKNWPLVFAPGPFSEAFLRWPSWGPRDLRRESME
jgi:hypothetical protein